MSRTLAMAVAGGLLFVSAALADVPLPSNLKYIDPRVSFQAVEKQPDYVFFLRFLTFSGGPRGVPYSLIPVKDSKAFNLNAQRRLTDMKLLAMGRTDFEKRSKDSPSLEWLTDKADGVLSADVVPPSTTAPADVKDAPVTTYQVSLKDGKLSVERAADDKPGKEERAGLLPTWAAGIGVAACAVCLGLWLARGKFARPAVTPARGPTADAPRQ